jgi:hypothetical protein
MPQRVLIALVVLSIAIVGCASPDEDSSTPTEPDEDAQRGPYDPHAEMRPELMELQPAAPTPGQIVALSFPQETERGVMFVLERQTGDDSWDHLYLMLSDSHHQPATFPPEADDLDWDDVGIDGPGPDRVALPEDLRPGEYRICTGNAGQNFCAPIEIASSD